MEYRQFADLKLSRLMIGTVQFGMDYGIANKTGQPSLKDVCNILSCAYEGGVTALDTARMYGTSEDVIGQALAELGLADKFTIVTKTAHFDEGLDDATADRLMEESIRESLKRLRLQSLPLCLIHHEENFRYFGSLLKLKERGLVRHAGSSVMSPPVTKGIVSSGLAEAVQVPTSILDRRYVRAGVFHDCKERGMGLFVRSIYLQGLVLMPDNEIAPGLGQVLPVLQGLRDLAAQAGMSLAELAVRYVLSLEGVTCGVVGVETVEQMKQNIAIFNKGPLDADMMKAVLAVVPDLPETILMPNKWPNDKWPKKAK
jgi:aryl-alcohol dehydrogenase-like predicted oxidoreductase